MTLPSGNPAGQVVNLLKAFTGQNLCSGPAAAAGGSIGDDRFLRIQLFEPGIQ